MWIEISDVSEWQYSVCNALLTAAEEPVLLVQQWATATWNQVALLVWCQAENDVQPCLQELTVQSHEKKAPCPYHEAKQDAMTLLGTVQPLVWPSYTFSVFAGYDVIPLM